MRALIDTNVLLDFLLGKEPCFNSADRIIKLCADKKIQGFMAAHSIPNMFYILRKDMTEEDRREMLLNLCDIFTIEGIDSAKIVAALKNSAFKDLEDCLQSDCAKRIRADYIVTRNIKDFAISEVPAILPEDFLKIIQF
ncbi:MAG: PIN domain-containing protein [Dorea sp.]|nr:PIN domain-containing protein [Dorea sp.]